MIAARPAGDAALLIEVAGGAEIEAAQPAQAVAAAVRARRLPGVLEAIPGARTVLVITEPGSWDLGQLAGVIETLPAVPAAAGRAAVLELPVVYDGPDLGEVARLTGLTAEDVIAAHQAPEYVVGWLGFSPGFGYLTGLDPALAGVPRLARPRQSVAAGSVAIAGGLAAVYPAPSPGGWRLLGRTSASLWDPWRDPPALLEPGLRVRFRAVAALADPAGAAGPAPAPHGPQPGPAGRPEIEVVRPGPLATIQDLGRRGHGHLGVPGSGAADPASLRLANRLAGNPPGSAAIELTLGRAALRFVSAAVVAVTGAPAELTVTSGPGQDEQAVSFAAAFGVPAGSVLRIGAPAAGLRSYLAVRGGIEVPPVLGSRSADLLSGLGPAPLRAGDLLATGPTGHAGLPRPAGPGAQPEAAMRAAPPVAGGPGAAGGGALLRVIAGPRDGWLRAGALGQLCQARYTVTPASNRAGLRLDGPPVAAGRGGELPSEGMATGSVQVPPDGRPILMLADHPVTGGYPVIAVVRSADIGLAAQLRPGQQVRFKLSR